MSKKIFSAQDWENVHFENSAPTYPKLLPAPNPASDNKEEEVERIIREIEQRGVDIAPEYKDWVELGFALVDGLGENGREYYPASVGFIRTIKGKKQTSNILIACKLKGKA